MNFLGGGFRKLSFDKIDRHTESQTDIQTDALEIIYHTASPLVRMCKIHFGLSFVSGSETT